NYGVSANGMPFAIALEKGFFKQQGLNITEIITSAGGGTTMRNMMAAGVPYAEINPGAAIGAIQQGVDLKIIADNVLTVAEFAWFVKPESKIRTIKDLKGAKVGFNNPRSTSAALLQVLLDQAGLRKDDVQMIRTGGFGESLTALDINTIDMTPITEPLWSRYKDKFRAIAVASEVLPPMSNVVGVALTSQMKEHDKFIRGVVKARRMAVEFMSANPQEAGDIVARAYNIDPALARAVVKNLVESRTQGIPYWGTGQIHLAGLERTVAAQRSVGAITGEVDLMKIIDTRFLDEDIRALVR
ncbi:MAG: ABC transporter substrate-binding protein, partial [Betaproteobacteria bacterium]|nr:ABC transporter substrate-binding protein [Betaproteobacteria bacterium]